MEKQDSKTRFLDAAIHVIRAKGYSATRIEDICAHAGLTKGSFFHHFKTKEDLAISAANHWTDVTLGLFEDAPYRALPDARERVFGYLDLRKAILEGDIAEFTCLVGTMVQEVYDESPAIRAACDASIEAHVVMLTAELAEAKKQCAPHADWKPRDAAVYIQAVLQGAFILAKAKHGPDVAQRIVEMLRDHVTNLLPPRKKKSR